MSAMPGADPMLEEVEQAQLRRLRVVSLIEGTTLVLLVCIGAPLKHLAGWPTVSSILGPVHGLVFLAYLWTVVETVSGGGWSGREIARLVAVAFVPFGSFTNGSFLKRKAASFTARSTPPGIPRRTSSANDLSHPTIREAATDAQARKPHNP